MRTTTITTTPHIDTRTHSPHTPNPPHPTPHDRAPPSHIKLDEAIRTGSFTSARPHPTPLLLVLFAAVLPALQLQQPPHARTLLHYAQSHTRQPSLTRDRPPYGHTCSHLASHPPHARFCMKPLYTLIHLSSCSDLLPVSTREPSPIVTLAVPIANHPDKIDAKLCIRLYTLVGNIFSFTSPS